MKKYLNSKEIVNKRVRVYFEDMLERFGNINSSFDMYEIIRSLFDYTYLLTCGAFEKKIAVCRYYLMSINYDYAYDCSKSANNTIYNVATLFSFFKEINMYYNLGFEKNQINVDNYLEKYIYHYQIDVNNKQQNCDLIYNFFNNYFDSKSKSELKLNEKSMIYEFCKNHYDLYSTNWLNYNLCYDEIKDSGYKINKENEILNLIYKKTWDYRHSIAHNLNSIYAEGFNESIILRNYFFQLSLLFCIDEAIIDIMNSKINEDIVV